jgi:hypothetical protein
MVHTIPILTGKLIDMKKIIFIFIALGTLTFSKCEKEELSLKRIDFNGNEIRLDGFYYNEPNKAHFFLYRNGVFFDGGTGFNGSLVDMEKFHSNIENYKTAYEVPYFWGVFRISTGEIQFAKWVSSDEFGRYTTTQFNGKIINDTTLLINHPAEMIGSDTFYFHRFSPKPDSTNNFIK